MKSQNKNIANYVNHVMSELNELTTDLYEAMMDQEFKGQVQFADVFRDSEKGSLQAGRKTQSFIARM